MQSSSSSNIPSKINQVGLHAGRHRSSAGIDVCQGILPGFGMRNRKINCVASFDVIGEHQCGENGKVMEGVFNI